MRRRPLLLLLAAGAVVVLCARSCGGPDQDPDPDPGPGPDPAAEASAGAQSGVPAAGAPGAGAPPSAGFSSPGPSLPPHAEEPGVEVTGEEAMDPAAVPDVVRAAEAFAQEWSTPDEQWRSRLAALATPALAAALGDPPAARDVSGPGFVLFDAPEWARVGVPTEQGTIVLDVAMVDGRWLVSAIAWWGSP